MKKLIILFLVIGILFWAVFYSGIDFSSQLETTGINWKVITNDVLQVTTIN